MSTTSFSLMVFISEPRLSALLCLGPGHPQRHAGRSLGSKRCAPPALSRVNLSDGELAVLLELGCAWTKKLGWSSFHKKGHYMAIKKGLPS
jgi:hypothetical protein